MNETSCNLPVELVELILVHCICPFPPLLLPQDQLSVATVLNVLRSAIVPDVSSAAIHKMPYIHMETGARIGSVHLLDLLLKRSRSSRNRRPLQYHQDKVVQLAIENGHIHVLDWWVSKGFTLGTTVFPYSDMPKFASAEVREWCLDHGYVFCPISKQRNWSSGSFDQTLAQTCALELSAKGLLFALEWWLKDFKRTLISENVDGTQCLIVALCCGHLEVAHWWIKTGLCDVDFDQRIVAELTASEFDFTCAEDALAFGKRVVDALPFVETIDPIFVIACTCGKLDLIQYCFDHPKFKRSHKARYQRAVKSVSNWLYSLAAVGGHVPVLEWLFANGFSLSKLGLPSVCQLRYYQREGNFLATVLKWVCPSMDQASSRGETELLDFVSRCGHVAVLNWFRRHLGDKEFNQYYTLSAMDGASREGHVQVLQWWLDSGPRLPFTRSAIRGACDNGHVQVLDWWYKSDLFKPRAWTCDSVHIENGWCRSFEVFEWWVSTTLPTSDDLTRLQCKVECVEHWRIIEWYRRNHNPHILSSVTIIRTYSFGHNRDAFAEVLMLWISHQCPGMSEAILSRLKYGDAVVLKPFKKLGDTLVLEHLKKLGLLSQPIDLDDAFASEWNGYAPVWSVATLDWLVKSGHPIEWGGFFLKWSTEAGHVAYLDWWASSGLDFKVDSSWDPLSLMESGDNKSDALTVSRAQAIRWWKSHSHLLTRCS